MTETTLPRWSTRDLPLIAKLVLTVFLVSVGLGYFSALVQLHLQHSSRQGDPLPSLTDVVEHFSGLKPFTDGDRPKSKIEVLISGPRDSGWGKSNMTPAFFEKSSRFEKDCQERGKETVITEREGERLAMLAWIHLEPATRQRVFMDNAMPVPDSLKSQPITEDFLDKDAGTIAIADIMQARCARCHKDGEQQPSLEEFIAIEPLITAPPLEIIEGMFGERWIRSGKQVSIEGLTQSTHAHLLSFAMLFMLTGLLFALSPYPAWLRLLLAPTVLLAQVADISCWWLARVPTYGPYFAQAIVLTGSIVGAGLSLQIILGLFGMYSCRGKLAILVLLLIGGSILGLITTQAIVPALQQEREHYEKRQQPEVELVSAEKATPSDTPAQLASAPPKTPATRVRCQLEKLIMGPTTPTADAPWDGSGSMAAAFFSRDGDDYKDQIKERAKAEVDAEREGERLALQAWILASSELRKASYEADAFPLPPDRLGQPITPRYLSTDKMTVAVKTILTDRCVRCHAQDGDVPDYPLETYEQLLKYMTTAPAPVDPPSPRPPLPPDTPAATPLDKPIPPAN